MLAVQFDHAGPPVGTNVWTHVRRKGDHDPAAWREPLPLLCLPTPPGSDSSRWSISLSATTRAGGSLVYCRRMQSDSILPDPLRTHATSGPLDDLSAALHSRVRVNEVALARALGMSRTPPQRSAVRKTAHGDLDATVLGAVGLAVAGRQLDARPALRLAGSTLTKHHR